MADQTMVVLEGLKSGPVDLWAAAEVQNGNDAGGDSWFIPNDGKTILIFNGVAGDTITFTAVTDEYGRTETLAPVVAMGGVGVFGPFLPELWNNSDSQVQFDLTAENAGDQLIAMRISKPT